MMIDDILTPTAGKLAIVKVKASNTVRKNTVESCKIKSLAAYE